MATTNYTITGHDFRIKTPDGLLFEQGGLAIVQWDLGYDPAQHPLNEWVQNPILVSWTAWYVKDYQGVGQGIFGSNGTTVVSAAPLYLFADFGNSSNYTGNPTMNGQVWMGQITDVLALPGGDAVIDLNTAHIRSVVGHDNAYGGLYSQDFNTWTPQAVPEPSYSMLAGVIFLGVVLLKKMKAMTSGKEKPAQ
jgi:hypothetical protein